MDNLQGPRRQPSAQRRAQAYVIGVSFESTLQGIVAVIQKPLVGSRRPVRSGRENTSEAIRNLPEALAVNRTVTSYALHVSHTQIFLIRVRLQWSSRLTGQDCWFDV